MVSRSAGIIAILCAVILAGCSNPLKKSVTESLTSNEIDKVVRKDISFLTTYSLVEGKWSEIVTTEDTLRWAPLTYERLHNYLKTIGSAEFNAPINSQLRDKWEDKFSNDNMKVDSLIGKWKKYITDNSPDSMAVAIYDGVEIEKVRNFKKEIDTLVKIRVKIKALKERIDSIHLSYAICDMLLDSTISQTPSSDNIIRHKRRVSDSVIIKVYPQIDNQQTKRRLIFKDSSLYFYPIVTTVFANGKCYNNDTLKNDVPTAISAIINSAESLDTPDFDVNYYREAIIREFLDPEYISQAAYIKLNAERYYREIDTLANSFTNL